MAIRDYLKVDSDSPEERKKINDFFDWVDNNNAYEISDSAKAAAELHGKKIIIQTKDGMPIGFMKKPPKINISFLRLNKITYFDNEGNSHSPSLASVMTHELKHAEDTLLTHEVIENYRNTSNDVSGFLFSDEKTKNKAEELFGGMSNNSRAENMIIGTQFGDILTKTIKRAIEHFSKAPEFIKNVQNFELEPIRAANIIRKKYENSAPRSEDYLDATKANLHRVKENIIKGISEQNYPLNPHPADFGKCPIPTKDLLAINQEKTTLKEAGVSPDADLSGCVLVAPDNVAGNKEYRNSVISQNER